MTDGVANMGDGSQPNGTSFGSQIMGPVRNVGYGMTNYPQHPLPPPINDTYASYYYNAYKDLYYGVNQNPSNQFPQAPSGYYSNNYTGAYNIGMSSNPGYPPVGFYNNNTTNTTTNNNNNNKSKLDA
ncbi:hypothetical protein, partial [Salmonella sp. s51228]|uniref:hypothetical protein n=1 Tax=Salmonella sp. s51228 TaxID=3159652 RepID=UPI003980C461